MTINKPKISNYKNFLIRVKKDSKIDIKNFKLKEKLSLHTTLGIGGPADLFYLANDTNSLIRIVRLAGEEDIPVTVLGGGSNVLVTDKGIRGLVIKNRAKVIKRIKNLVQVDSGVFTQSLVNWSIENGLDGLQYYSGFYGTVGGAVYNNAHFKNHFIFDNLLKVRVLDKDNKPVWLEKKDIFYGYDYTSFHKDKKIILQVIFKLAVGDVQKLKQEAREIIKLRQSKHPVREKSAGCFFQNPSCASSGSLIEKAGLKGKKVGGAMVSKKHAAFIINDGKATAKDILKLTSLIQKQVKEKFKVELKTEVFTIGEK